MLYGLSCNVKKKRKTLKCMLVLRLYVFVTGHGCGVRVLQKIWKNSKTVGRLCGLQKGHSTNGTDEVGRYENFNGKQYGLCLANFNGKGYFQ